MNAKLRSLALAILALAAVPSWAQPKSPAPSAPAAPVAQPSPTPEARPKAVPEKPSRGQPVNVRVDVTLTDRRGSEPPITKTVSLVAADQGNAFVRSMSQAPAGTGLNANALEMLPLNVDASPTIEDGRIRLRLSLEYSFVDRTGNEPRFPKIELRKRLDLFLENGKPLNAAESADPLSDRRVSLEVKATILR